MKILVVFMSQTGNTEKIARTIFEEIGDIGEIKSMDNVDGLEGYDFAFVGFPIQAFGPAVQAKAFLQSHADGKKLALFITHAVPEGHPELKEWLTKCRQAAEGAEIVNMFDCQGELGQEIMTFLKKSDDPKMRAFGEQGAATKGQPDATRIESARQFAKETIKMVMDRNP